LTVFRPSDTNCDVRRGDDARTRRKALRLTGAAVGAVLTMTLLAGPVTAAPTPPPNPTDGQISQAQQAKNSMAASVGRLSALVAQAQSQLDALTARAALAEQKFALAVSRLMAAKDDAVRAKAEVDAAEKQVAIARRNLTSFVRESYMSTTVTGGPAGLLTAPDPNAVLQQGDYTRYVADRHLDAKSALDRATVNKSNADARARAAVALQTRLTKEAEEAKNAAIEAVNAQRQQEHALRVQKNSFEHQLAVARSRLATLNGQLAIYVAWQKEQARIAAERARQLALARERARQAAIAAAAARAAAQQNQNNGNDGSVYNPPVTPAPMPGAGPWSAEKGQRAVERARQYIGWNYVWAGGNQYGPTSACTWGSMAGDCGEVGFDCSGLAMYAWGMGWDHYAATQYWQAGSFHPNTGQLMPGDLLFWGDSQPTIHHVAIYSGNGMMVEAPNSWELVQEVPVRLYGDYFGATRPFT